MLLRSWGLCAIRSTYRLCNNKMKMLITFFFRIGLFLWNCPTYDFVSVIFCLVVSLTLCSGINLFTKLWIYRLRVAAKNTNPSQNPLFLCEWQNWLRIKRIKRNLFTAEVSWSITFANAVTLKNNYPLSKGKEYVCFLSISTHVNKLIAFFLYTLHNSRWNGKSIT